jgi:hypothetical protein
MIYSGWDNAFDLALLQGGLDAATVPQGLVVKWNALYGYVRTQRPEIRGVEPNSSELNALERRAFEFAHAVYTYVYEYVQPIGARRTSHNGDTILEIEIEELRGLEDKIMNHLENVFFRSGRIRDYDGQYHWIGLDAYQGQNKMEVSTPIKIPNLIEGRKDINLIASVTPYSSEADHPIDGRSDDYQTALISGLIHAFEDRTRYNEHCAIRAALISYVFSGSFRPEVLLAAAARVSLYPRLGSMDKADRLFWKKIYALGVAWTFFDRYYSPQNGWKRPVGQVRYIFSGQGAADLIAKKILRYAKSSMVNLSEDIESSSTEGIFWFPANNTPGNIYKFGFAKYHPVGSKGQHSIIEPNDAARIYMKWRSDPVLVTEDKILNLDMDQQQSWDFHPVILSRSKSIRFNFEYLGAGLVSRHTTIKDILEKNTEWMPSDMLKTLITGWPPSYTPKGAILVHQHNPTQLNEFKDFTVLYGPHTFRRPDADESEEA